MDQELRRNQRRACLETGGSARLSHARGLARAGHFETARAALAETLGAGRLEESTLLFLRDLALRGEHVGGPPQDRVPTAPVDLIVNGSVPGCRGLAEVAPAVAFVGQDSASPVEALLTLFSRCAPRCRSYRVMDERVLELCVPLQPAWRLGLGYAAGSLRILSLPNAVKFRRPLLRSASAVVLVVGEGDRPTELEALVDGLRRDLRLTTGARLESHPLLIQYRSRREALQHVELSSRLGLPGAGWAVVERDAEGGLVGLPELLAALLLEVARGVSGLVRPRSRG